MKNLFIFMMVLFLSMPVWANHIEGVENHGQVVHVKALGLVCDFCAQALEKVFYQKEEVQHIKVDLANKDITVTMKEGVNLDDQIIKTLIEDSGYNVENISRETH